MFNIQCSMFIVHCSMFNVHCSLSIVHCSLSIVHCSLSIVHCPLSIVLTTHLFLEKVIKKIADELPDFRVEAVTGAHTFNFTFDNAGGFQGF